MRCPVTCFGTFLEGLPFLASSRFRYGAVRSLGVTPAPAAIFALVFVLLQSWQWSGIGPYNMFDAALYVQRFFMVCRRHVDADEIVHYFTLRIESLRSVRKGYLSSRGAPLTRPMGEAGLTPPGGTPRSNCQRTNGSCNFVPPTEVSTCTADTSCSPWEEISCVLSFFGKVASWVSPGLCARISSALERLLGFCQRGY